MIKIIDDNLCNEIFLKQINLIMYFLNKNV